MITYVRVSTSQQGRSGLGIEAQRRALQQFAKAEGLELTREFVEVETGKGEDAIDRRPQLKAALAAAKKFKCNVAVAKLDRLSRDVHFISGLMAHRVPFAPGPPRLGICFSQDACCYWYLAQPKSLAPQPHPGWYGFGRGSVLRDADATRKGRCNRHDAAIELQPERRKGTRSRPKYHLGSVSGIEDRGVA
jgi:hypothetical protein